MKRTLLVTILCACLATVAAASEFAGSFAAEACAAAHQGSAKHQCSEKCVEHGETIVFVDEKGKIHAIDDEVWAAAFLGKKVVVSGELDDDGLTIEEITAADGEAKK